MLAPRHSDAQEPPLVVPGDGTITSERLEPFEAEYEQAGYPMRAVLVRGSGPDAVWSFRMVVEGPDGVGIDHVGHLVDDVGFAFRRFGFGAFRDEYIEASVRDSELLVRRLGRDTVAVPAPATIPIDASVYDGTFVYWLFGALPLADDAAWRFRTWSVTEDGAVARESSPVRVVGRRVEALPDGTTATAWALESGGGAGRLVTWVVARPPYLVRQEHVDEAGTVTPVLSLASVR